MFSDACKPRVWELVIELLPETGWCLQLNVTLGNWCVGATVTLNTRLCCREIEMQLLPFKVQPFAVCGNCHASSKQCWKLPPSYCGGDLGCRLFSASWRDNWGQESIQRQAWHSGIFQPVLIDQLIIWCGVYFANVYYSVLIIVRHKWLNLSVTGGMFLEIVLQVTQ